MKTQLLEDIGQSATLSLVPSGSISNSQKAEQDHAQQSAAAPVKPRAAFVVWRRQPEDEPAALTTAPPTEEAQHEPPLPIHDADIPPVEPMAAQNETQGPFFDFMLPPPPASAPVADKLEPGWFKRSGRRYLLWGTCLLAAALLIQGGRWLYEESKDASVLALVADELGAEPPVDKAVRRRAMGAKEFTLGPRGEVIVAPAVSVSAPNPVPRATAPLPPLVMLEPEPTTETKVEPGGPQREEISIATKPEPAVKPAPAHQHRREPAVQAKKEPEPESAASATLKACREHGYHADQCIKRACSVTKYGFVCRGK